MSHSSDSESIGSEGSPRHAPPPKTPLKVPSLIRSKSMQDREEYAARRREVLTRSKYAYENLEEEDFLSTPWVRPTKDKVPRVQVWGKHWWAGAVHPPNMCATALSADHTTLLSRCVLKCQCVDNVNGEGGVNGAIR